MLNRIKIIMCLSMLTLLASGCAGVGKDVNASWIDSDDLLKIKIGMPLTQLVTEVGKPSSFGLDETGQRFFRYNGLKSKTNTFVVPLPGFFAHVQTTYQYGLDIFVYHDGHTVTSIKKASYEGQAGDNYAKAYSD